MPKLDPYYTTPVRATKRGIFTRKPKGGSPVSVVIDDGTFRPTTETHHLIKFTPPSHSTRKEARANVETALRKTKLKDSSSPIKSSLNKATPSSQMRRTSSFSSQVSTSSSKSGRSIKSWGSGIANKFKDLRRKKTNKDKMKFVKQSCVEFESQRREDKIPEFLQLDFLCSGLDGLCGTSADDDLIGKVIGSELDTPSVSRKFNRMKR